MTPLEKIKSIQTTLEVTPDGQFGPKSRAALESLIQDAKTIPAPSSAPDGATHKVKASSFADPVDVAAFKRCKAKGGTDQECFKVGDNGIGKWGDDTTGPVPMCALPPEDWEHLGSAARGAKVLVVANKASVVCELRDTMPHKAHIQNGAGIDLNPAAVNALGLRPPIMVDATWQWA